jgi:Na+/proline symporter
VNTLDYVVLIGSILAIALYGILRTRGRRNLHDYLRGQKKQSWIAIGASVAATQASAVTFLSTPGQGYQDGMAFVQNYFAMPLALVIIAAFFLPIYRKLNVYTAYEYLGKRFDKKTRLLAASLFLFQRALAAGFTLYAPAIVLSTVFGWSLHLTILLSGIVVIAYTVAGGSDAVTHTQKYQFAIIMACMITAFFILLSKIPCSFTDALALAGHFGKTNAVSFNPDLRERYTFWTGMLGGIFLMLSYFGTDQSQVQRYISGDNLRESRIGLMANALLKIPMQFGILLLGVMLFVFYQFNPSPAFFNTSELKRQAHSTELVTRYFQISPSSSTFEPRTEPLGPAVAENVEKLRALDTWKRTAIQSWHDYRQSGNLRAADEQLEVATKYYESAQLSRAELTFLLKSGKPATNSNDSDYVFITFILDHLPHGLIGLLVASFFFATLGSKAGELNALASCSVVDFYRFLVRPPEDDNYAPNHAASAHDAEERHYVRASRAFTLFWGLVSLLCALFLFPHFAENLIQATNIVASIFYGGILGLFLIAFFLKFIGGTAAFTGALIGQAVVFGFLAANYLGYSTIAYLWYNPIGCLTTLAAATLIQLLLGQPPGPGFPVEHAASASAPDRAP